MADEIPPGRRAELDQQVAMVKEMVDTLVAATTHYRHCPDPEHRVEFRTEILGDLVEQEKPLVTAVLGEVLLRLSAHEEERETARTLARVLFGATDG